MIDTELSYYFRDWLGIGHGCGIVAGHKMPPSCCSPNPCAASFSEPKVTSSRQKQLTEENNQGRACNLFQRPSDLE